MMLSGALHVCCAADVVTSAAPMHLLWSCTPLAVALGNIVLHDTLLVRFRTSACTAALHVRACIWQARCCHIMWHAVRAQGVTGLRINSW
jgi:hypothetical protein